jgi:hypothetical protein
VRKVAGPCERVILGDSILGLAKRIAADLHPCKERVGGPAQAARAPARSTLWLPHPAASCMSWPFRHSIMAGPLAGPGPATGQVLPPRVPNESPEQVSTQHSAAGQRPSTSPRIASTWGGTREPSMEQGPACPLWSN